MSEVVGLDKIELITKRDLKRKLDLQKRKDNKDSLCADNEKLEYFEETFASKRNEIENLIVRSTETAKNQLADHFNNISREVLILQKYVAASNIFLRSYDIKKCQTSLQELTNKAKELEDELLPKKKFGFKNRNNKAKVVETINHKDEVDFSKTTNLSKVICGFSNESGKELVKVGEDIYKKDITAENLDNCTVKFLGTPSTLHLNHLNNCKVFTGPVSTSVFAENCRNCTLVLACQQLRLHGSRNVKIYLHVTSRAIMEDCNQIYLAPYNWKYPGIKKDFDESGLNIAVNNWKCIDDFNWLHLEKQSPNWSVLDEDSIEEWSD